MSNGTTVTLEAQTVTVSPDGTTTIYRSPKTANEAAAEPATVLSAPPPADPPQTAIGPIEVAATSEEAAILNPETPNEEASMTQPLKTTYDYVTTHPWEAATITLGVVLFVIAVWQILKYLRRKWIEQFITEQSVRGFRRDKDRLTH